MHRIAIAGHVCIDIRPGIGAGTGIEPGRLFEVGAAALSLGGPVGNSGASLVALGAPISVFAAVGDDRLGDIVRSELAAMTAGAAVVQVVPGAGTSYSIVLEPPGVDRTFWHHVGANAVFDGSGVDLTGVDLLHLGYPPLLPAMLADDGEPLHRMLSSARAQAVTTSVDLAVVDPESPVGGLDWERILARMAAQTDVLSPSLDDLTSALGIAEPYSPELVARLADQLLRWGAAVVAITAGEHGMLLRTAGTARLSASGRALAGAADDWADVTLHVPAAAAGSVATTNGAGDASTAGLLYGIAAGLGPAASARLAAACAAALVRGESITPALVASV